MILCCSLNKQTNGNEKLKLKLFFFFLYGNGVVFTESQVVRDRCVSGKRSLAKPSAPGAAITLAAIR